MSNQREKVYSVISAYNGRPKQGLADFLGQPHQFWLLGFGSIDLYVPMSDRINNCIHDHDMYELYPVGNLSLPKIVRHGSFCGRDEGAEIADSSIWGEVSWGPLTIIERIDRIFQAQGGGDHHIGLPRPMAFLVGDFYLNDEDLAAIRPYLDNQPPDVGQVGRYMRVPIFPLHSLQSGYGETGLPITEYEGIVYRYGELLDFRH
jgi:hypothetical protein